MRVDEPVAPAIKRARRSRNALRMIDLVETGHVDGREFETEKTAAGLQHAVSFAEGAVDARHVADAEGDRSLVGGLEW